MSQPQIAERIGVTKQCVSYHELKALNTLSAIDPTNPILLQRRGLTGLLPKTTRVYDKAISTVADTDDYTDKHMELALRASDTLNRGLHVLSDRQEITRSDVQAQLNMQANVTQEFIERLTMLGLPVPQTQDNALECQVEQTPPPAGDDHEGVDVDDVPS